MRRRAFMAGVAVTMLPFAVHAQRAAKRPIIGFLGATTPELAARADEVIE